MKLIRVTLRIRNQEAALRFYTETLGFVKTADFPLGPAMRWVTVAPAEDQGVQIVLQPPEWFQGDEYGQHMQSVGHNPPIVFEVEDCAAVFAQLEKKGVRFSTPPSQRPYGVEAVGLDMDGNTLVFLQPAAMPR